jgi:hypothetical protein
MRRSDFIFNYRLTNWPEYNKALISRGSLSVWVDEQAVSAWRHRGGPRARRGGTSHQGRAALPCRPMCS